MAQFTDEELRDASAVSALGTVLSHTYDDSFREAVATAFRIGAAMVDERRRLDQLKADQKEAEKNAKKDPAEKK